MTQLSVGRVVHFLPYSTAEWRAAIVTGVVLSEGEDSISLAVLDVDGISFKQDVAHAEDKTGDTWHWPERV